MENWGPTTEFNTAAAPPGPSKAVSIVEAMKIFDALADRENIAFGYAQDGCYARAHIMCRAMQALGLTPQKAWAFEGKNGVLEVQKPDNKMTYWSFHVAPTLPVVMLDGKAHDMVFDPGLFDGPVPLQEWGAMINASPERLCIVPFGEIPKGETFGDYIPGVENTTDATDREASSRLSQYMGWQDKSARILFATATRAHVRTTEPDAFPLQGKNWISEKIYVPPVNPVKKARKWLFGA